MADSAVRKSRRNPIVVVIDLFSSIAFGISMLALVLIYSTVVSAIPAVARALELTEMEAFRHWLFVTLITLFATSLTLVTLRKIRWTVINLGVLTVHAGLLTFVVGSIWYFFKKHEGDVRLDSPRIELVTIGTQESREVAKILAEKDQTWSATMPAFGGRVSITVLETTQAGLQVAQKAKVRVSVGEAEPKVLELTLVEKPLEAISDRLAVRLIGSKPQEHFYDEELPALWARPAEGPGRKHEIVPIRGLPLHVERYGDEGYTLRDTSGRPFVSRRPSPELDLGFVKIPTGWFEQWRLPIPLETPQLPFDVAVTGYVPYTTQLEPIAAPGGDKLNPAANIQITFGRTSVTESLFALDPIGATGRQMSVEYRWVSSIEERDALLRPLAGQHELTVELVNPPFRKTYSITQGQTIQLEGTSYELKIAEIIESWPLMSPGFEDARSPVARVDVKSGEKSYNRTVVQRFPALSQDIDEAGMRKKDGPYDPNLVLRYRTTGSGSVLLVGGSNVPHQLGVFLPDGNVNKLDVTAGRPSTLGSGSSMLTIHVRDLIEKAERSALPIVVPPEARRPGLGRQASAIRVRLTGRGENAGWSKSTWVLHSDYPDIEPVPMFIRVPGEPRPWELLYSRFPRPLGATLAAKKMWVESYPGQRSAAAWQSDVLFRADGASEVGETFTRTNETINIGEWTYFQSGAATDNWSFTILGVGNRHGILAMNLGWIMVTIGCLYAFYFKPILKKRQAAAALERAAMQRKSQQAARELSEVAS
ncbi:MAG: hypothetical protein ACKVS9_03725 [Phycisphaerae bacterium]